MLPIFRTSLGQSLDAFSCLRPRRKLFLQPLDLAAEFVFGQSCGSGRLLDTLEFVFDGVVDVIFVGLCIDWHHLGDHLPDI